MSRRLRLEPRNKQAVKGRGWLGALILLTLTVVIVGVMWRGSTVAESGRYNLVVAGEGATSFVSIDPVERTVFVIDYPPNLAIKSRSVGEYEVGKLYTLGEYDAEPGEFVRIKVQGFMKTLIHGYLVMPEKISRLTLLKHLISAVYTGKPKTTLTPVDAVILLTRVGKYDYRQVGTQELLRAGVIGETEGRYNYNPDRLQQYLGLRVFDWGIGSEGISVVVINESQESGMASDVAKFLENSGMDVVAVRSGEELAETTRVMIANEELRDNLSPLLSAFGWREVQVKDTSEWRADIVVLLGKDGLKLF